MSSLAATPAYSSQSGGTGDANWSGSSVALSTGQQSKSRIHVINTALDAIHDGCVITNILVSGVASCSHSLGGGYQFYGILLRTFAGAGGDIVSVSGTGLTTTPTTKSQNGGAGTAPSLVRGAAIVAFARNNDTFYSVTDTISSLTVTITYTDNGLPAMIQFAL